MVPIALYDVEEMCHLGDLPFTAKEGWSPGSSSNTRSSTTRDTQEAQHCRPMACCGSMQPAYAEEGRGDITVIPW